MKAVIFDRPGEPEVLKLGEAPEPAVGPRHLLVAVRYAGVNRADLMQRAGSYPPPPGASEILGLECAGEVIQVGPGVKDWHVGERVMALLAGGGYAERAAVDAGSAMRVPAVLSDEEAAAIPEVFLTVFLNVFTLGGVKEGETVLVHGGGSGVGTAAIVLLKEAKARVVVTAGSDEKCARCLKLGADAAINYQRTPAFAQPVIEATEGRGADLILDIIGAAYLAQNIEALARGGRLVLLALMKGSRAEIDLGAVHRKHLHLIGSTLRSRPVEEKAEIVSGFVRRFGPALQAGRIRPQLHAVLPAAQAAEAHRIIARSEHFGKVVLRMA
ncbi:MAG: NAD(P)H-quinone oxidoreductase [Deltaproteobacteria bacterium]|nr:NAD(P)H-quinone oxidoreductase [Deltaproteobacteria bacterium]